MGSNREYSIPFEGLKIGKHSFEYHITTAFFEELTYSIIKGGDIEVHFELEKKETMMIGQFEMSGTVQKPCDRCNDLMDIPITVSHQIIYKFSDGESEDENLIMVPHSAFEIDIADTIYELLTVALPIRSVHEEDECNEEMLDLLDEYVGYSEEYVEEEEDDSTGSSPNEEDDGEESDPRWDALKKLK